MCISLGYQQRHNVFSTLWKIFFVFFFVFFSVRCLFAFISLSFVVSFVPLSIFACVYVFTVTFSFLIVKLTLALLITEIFSGIIFFFQFSMCFQFNLNTIFRCYLIFNKNVSICVYFLFAPSFLLHFTTQKFHFVVSLVLYLLFFG